jgi:hypothetical protein
MERLNMQRSEVMAMPTYERRFHLAILKKAMEQDEESEADVSYREDGRKVESFTGDALKQKLKNNEIPN